MHNPQRSETTVPQQALFFMNAPFVVEQARALAARVGAREAGVPENRKTTEERIKKLHRLVYQREPTPGQLKRGLQFISAAGGEGLGPHRGFLAVRAAADEDDTCVARVWALGGEGHQRKYSVGQPTLGPALSYTTRSGVTDGFENRNDIPTARFASSYRPEVPNSGWSLLNPFRYKLLVSLASTSQTTSE